jgi:CubicO group peptidase (beta-lactamase class C family)
MRRPTRAILLFAVAITAASFARAQEPSGPAGVDAFVQGLMAKHHVPGVSVGVVQDGKVVMAKGYGLANVELDVLATENSVYQLASVTKTFTATAVMLLVKDGKLSLDDKLAERLPDLPAAWEKVTVRNLLNHTSGIKSYTSVKGFEKTMRKDYTHREIIDLVAKEPLEFAPGEKWDYSNTGYFLLGMLIEKASGKPYEAFMAERVFKPLGMTRTRVNDLQAVVPNRVQGYQWDGKELKNGEYVSPSQPFAAGMLLSTVADLIKWDAALADHKVLDEPTLEQMWKPTTLAKGEAPYGFGWGVKKVNGRRVVEHGGGIPGFSTQVCRYLDDKLTVIVLSNAGGGHAGALAHGIAALLVPALKEKPAAPIADKDAKTTERLRRMVEALLKGELDPELFTEEAGKALSPRVKDVKEQLAPLGELKTFELVDRKEAAGGLRLRYRATLEKATLKVIIPLDAAGKIQGVLLLPED